MIFQTALLCLQSEVSYVNSHLFTCRHWVAACLFKYTSRCWGVFLIGQIFFYSEGLGAKRNVSGKLGMKLAISLGPAIL